MNGLEHVAEHWRTGDGETLYGPSAMATALEVTPSAVANYIARGTGPVPAPAHWRPDARYGRRVPLWTRAQLESARRDAIAELERRLAELEGRIARQSRTAAGYRHRLARLRVDSSSDGMV